MTSPSTSYQHMLHRHTLLTQAYVCQFCQLHFRGLEPLKVHVTQFHTGALPLTCDYCEQDFQSKLAARIEGFIPANEKNRMKVMFYSPLIFKCDEDLIFHCQVRHNVVSPSAVDSNETFQCHRCQTYCNSRVDLQAHFEEHPIVNDDGTCGCVIYELFRMSLGEMATFKLKLKERKLKNVFLDILSAMPIGESAINSMKNLNIKDLTKVFCKLMMLRPCEHTEELLSGPLHRLIFDMVFILREICIEEPHLY